MTSGMLMDFAAARSDAHRLELDTDPKQALDRK
jgi:hypothetical protein